MQDIIEGDAISLWRLFNIALHASAMLLVVTLTPKFENQNESF